MSWTKKAYCTYLLANRKNGTIYVGVSGNLSKRMLEDKNGTNEGFSKNTISRNWYILSRSRSLKMLLNEKSN